MTYRELFYKATRLIDNNKITLGEYEEMTKPLDREIEQEPILDKIRAEIAEIPKKYPMTMDYENGLKEALGIIDKYKADRREETIIDKLIDDIECTTWYHINRNGELVGGANSAEDDALYKAKDILKVLEKYRREE